MAPQQALLLPGLLLQVLKAVTSEGPLSDLCPEFNTVLRCPRDTHARSDGPGACAQLLLLPVSQGHEGAQDTSKVPGSLGERLRHSEDTATTRSSVSALDVLGPLALVLR